LLALRQLVQHIGGLVHELGELHDSTPNLNRR
jgi:hypothetical protein